MRLRSRIWCPPCPLASYQIRPPPARPHFKTKISRFIAELASHYHQQPAGGRANWSVSAPTPACQSVIYTPTCISNQHVTFSQRFSHFRPNFSFNCVPRNLWAASYHAQRFWCVWPLSFNNVKKPGWFGTLGLSIGIVQNKGTKYANDDLVSKECQLRGGGWGEKSS